MLLPKTNPFHSNSKPHLQSEPFGPQQQQAERTNNSSDGLLQFNSLKLAERQTDWRDVEGVSAIHR